MAVTKRYPKGKQRLFTNDLKSLLHAYGDTATPNIETIHALEDALTSYLTDLILEANRARVLQGRTKFLETDYMFALRRDPAKLARFHDLWHTNTHLVKAQKLFDAMDTGAPGAAAAAGMGRKNKSKSSAKSKNSTKKSKKSKD